MYRVRMSLEYDDYKEDLTAVPANEDLVKLLENEYEDFEAGLVGYIDFILQAYHVTWKEGIDYENFLNMNTDRLIQATQDKMNSEESMAADIQRDIEKSKRMKVYFHLVSEANSTLLPTILITHEWDADEPVEMHEDDCYTYEFDIPVQIDFDFTSLSQADLEKAFLYLPVISKKTVSACCVELHFAEYAEYFLNFFSLDEIVENIVLDAEADYHTDFNDKREEIKALLLEYLKSNDMSISDWKYEYMLFPYPSEAQTFAVWSRRTIENCDTDQVENYEYFQDQVIKMKNGFLTDSSYMDGYR